ncbi:MAG TPA: carbamoyl phosphate synthase large subunit, partial [Myxococcota bacterium]|nr:carbamoyl phosphate synthase large subunit [Myxococcota bacterium]
MAIGRSFKESLQKAMASIDGKDSGFFLGDVTKNDHHEMLKKATPKRLWHIAECFRQGSSIEQVSLQTNIHRWFLANIAELVAEEQNLKKMCALDLTAGDFRRLKKQGFLDQRLAELMGTSEQEIRTTRKKLGVIAQFKRVDTCAAEFIAHTPYYYSSYEEPFFAFQDGVLLPQSSNEAEPINADEVVVLGSGAIRIGQGIEFDCCATESVQALKKIGLKAIMINCNPETVSTDFDISDRLYFEPITLEHVLNVIDCEQPLGVIVQLGGQTPLSLARELKEAGVAILGTSADDIDRAEDRLRSREVFHSLGLSQPASISAQSVEEAKKGARLLGYPLMVRPSYVLGGRAMERVHNEK